MTNIIQPIDIGQYLDAPECRGWSYNDHEFLIKEFKFKNFSEAFAFMTRIAMLCEKFDHHPEWSNSYNIVKIKLKSHDVNGISLRDIKLAKAINALIL